MFPGVYLRFEAYFKKAPPGAEKPGAQLVGLQWGVGAAHSKSPARCAPFCALGLDARCGLFELFGT